MTTIARARLDGRRKLSGLADAPQLDADLLLAHALGTGREALFSHGEDGLTARQGAIYSKYLDARSSGKPVAYLTGTKEWFGLQLMVTDAVLVPRPETEILVEKALTLARRLGVRRLVDVGTGSGAIAVALALALPDLEVFATDISPEALAVAEGNVRRFGVDGRVCLLRGDLIEPVRPQPDFVVANLPYIAENDESTLCRDVRSEPRIALLGGKSGLEPIGRLLGQIAERGWRPAILLEIGAEQGPAVSALALDMLKGYSVEIEPDLEGRDRVAVLVPQDGPHQAR